MARQIQIDNYTIKVFKDDFIDSNYNVSVQLFKDNNLIKGRYFKEDVKDIDLIVWAIDNLYTKSDVEQEIFNYAECNTILSSKEDIEQFNEYIENNL